MAVNINHIARLLGSYRRAVENALLYMEMPLQGKRNGMHVYTLADCLVPHTKQQWNMPSR